MNNKILNFLILFCFILVACNSYNPKKREPGVLYDVDHVLPSKKKYLGKWELKNAIIYFDRTVYDTLIKQEYEIIKTAKINGDELYISKNEIEFIENAYKLSTDTSDTLDITNLKCKFLYDSYDYLNNKEFFFDLMYEFDYRIFNKKTGRFEDTVVLWDRDDNLPQLFFKNGQRILRFRQSGVRVKF